jgi:hypothetical protein
VRADQLPVGIAQFTSKHTADLPVRSWLPEAITGTEITTPNRP